MIKQVKIRLEALGDGLMPSLHWGSVMHGVLIQSINPEYADELHREGLKPINQYILPCRESISSKSAVWTINLLGKEAVEFVLPELLKKDAFYVEKHKTALRIKELNVLEEIGEEDFCKAQLLDGAPQKYKELEFITPCSHKSNGQYCIFPSEELLIRSLVQKWNAYAKSYKIEDEEAIEHIVSHTRISSYRLNSTAYHLEGVKIPSFTGRVSLAARGPEPLLRLQNMILSFAPYSGVGIKTSLGMGAVRIAK